MLEYAYQILQKLSFDRGLFHKELKKLVSYLTNDEVVLLKQWLENNYSTEYLQSEYFD